MNLLELIKKILNFLFPPKPYIVHPQEPMNPSQIMDVEATRRKWLTEWNVPAEYHDYWKSIPIKLDSNLPCPAWALSGQLSVRPEWLSPGVLAHEMAHISYSLLTDEEKTGFETVYKPLVYTDPYILLLYSQNTYGLVSTIEGHAELYRYLFPEIPDVLKKYYPKLI